MSEISFLYTISDSVEIDQPMTFGYSSSQLFRNNHSGLVAYMLILKVIGTESDSFN